MPKKSFAQLCGDWVSKTEGRMTAVLQQSVQEVVTNAQRPIAQGGSMPVVTGNLRGSLIVAIEGVQVGSGASAHVNAIPLMKYGSRILIGWTAVYARRMEYGFSGTDSLGRTYDQQGYGFLRLAVGKWESIVRNNARSAERVFGSNE